MEIGHFLAYATGIIAIVCLIWKMATDYAKLKNMATRENVDEMEKAIKEHLDNKFVRREVFEELKRQVEELKRVKYRRD